ATHTIETHVRKRNVRLSIFIARNVFPNGTGRAPNQSGWKTIVCGRKQYYLPLPCATCEKVPLAPLGGHDSPESRRVDATFGALSLARDTALTRIKNRKITLKYV
ncbi:hypothetical protein CDAR_175591, partial [Caerostris darwini]